MGVVETALKVARSVDRGLPRLGGEGAPDLCRRSAEAGSGGSRRTESSWSNGQTEGQTERLKLLTRQMDGRAKLDLLRIRILKPVSLHFKRERAMAVPTQDTSVLVSVAKEETILNSGSANNSKESTRTSQNITFTSKEDNP